MKDSTVDVTRRGLHRCSLFVLFSMMLTAYTALAQSAGDYRSATSGDWNVAATWETYNGSSWIPASVSPDNTDGVTTVRGGHTVTVTATGFTDELFVEATAQITINTGLTLKIEDDGSAAVDATINGTIDVGAGTFKLMANAQADFNTGGHVIVRANGAIGDGASDINFVFNDGSTYEHLRDSGGLPAAAKTTWNAGSTCIIGGADGNLPGNRDQVFHHLIYNRTGQTINKNLSGNPDTINGDFTVASTGSGLLSWRQSLNRTFTIGGNLVVSGGTFAIIDGSADSVLDVAGDVIQTGGTFEMTTGNGDVSVQLAGDFNQTAGIITETGTTGTGTFLFDGTSTQNITANGTISEEIYFTLNNSNGLALQSNFTPPRALTLTSGNLTTSSNELIIAGSASLDAGSNYISGALKQTYSTTGSKVFDVGTAGGYAPVTVNVTAGSGEVTVEAKDGIHPNSGSSDVLERYWELTGPTITGADLTFEYLDTDVPGGADEADFVIGKYSGGEWTYPGGSVNTVTNTATLTGVTSFSDWTLGDPDLLPVEMVSFEAVTDDADVLLRWETASETNNAGFFIEQADGSDQPFSQIAFVDGYGTTEFAQSYTYRVEDLAPGHHVFRLKQIDFDGTFEYHPEVEVIVEMDGRFVMEPVYPNPFNPQAQFSFAVQRAQQVRAELFDLLGRRVRVLYAGLAQAGQVHEVRIDGSDLPSGLYVVRVVGERFAKTQTVTLLK